MTEKKLFVILGNQLFNPEIYLNKYKNYTFFMAEDYGLCSFYKHHKFKILHTLSSMRSYRDELNALGFKVKYFSIEEESFYDNYITKLKIFIRENIIETLTLFEVEDKLFEKEINALENICNVVFLNSPMFLTKREDFKSYISTRKPLMGNFYKYSRIKNNLLLKKSGEPIGGKWSFDEENRKKLPRGIKIPTIAKSKKTSHTIYLSKIIEKIFKKNIGDCNDFWIPTDRYSSKIFLQDFLDNRFYLFGDYEDAISKKESFLFHSAISPLLNTGLLTPNEILDKIKGYEDKININSLEGFVRQVIGWREFIRGIYQLKEKSFIEKNYFNNSRKMKKSWYEGTTGIDPLDDAIKKASQLGWSHHIERLMIIANLMNLCQIRPRQVFKWFMEFYVDSADWVMVPNVYGMGLFSDGGIFSTKPYVCGSNYILKMSDYKKGPWVDIVDGLYWQFISKNREKLKNNPRIGIMSKMVDNMNKDRKSKIFKAAEDFLERNTTR